MKTFQNLTGLVLVSLLTLVGCQKDESSSRKMLSQSSDAGYVEAADGSLYSISCLRQLGNRLQSEGQSAMNECLMDSSSLSSSVSGNAIGGRGRLAYSNCYGSSCNNSSYIYYPPTYCPPTYNNYSFPITYKPWQDTRYNNDLFCGFVFGGTNSVNCYYLFGYKNPSSYSSYYNSSCSSQCLFSLNYNSCMQNKCTTPIYWAY